MTRLLCLTHLKLCILMLQALDGAKIWRTRDYRVRRRETLGAKLCICCYASVMPPKTESWPVEQTTIVALTNLSDASLRNIHSLSIPDRLLVQTSFRAQVARKERKPKFLCTQVWSAPAASSPRMPHKRIIALSYVLRPGLWDFSVVDNGIISEDGFASASLILKLRSCCHFGI